MKRFVITLTLFVCFIFSSCIPSFPENTVDASDFFTSDVYYTTFYVDLSTEEGIVISPELTDDKEIFIDGDEQNAPYRTYNTLSFKTDIEGTLTYLFFSITADTNCTLRLNITYGEILIKELNLILTANTQEIIYLPELNLELEEGELLTLTTTNPLELGNVTFSTDGFMFLGEQ